VRGVFTSGRRHVTSLGSTRTGPLPQNHQDHHRTNYFSNGVSSSGRGKSAATAPVFKHLWNVWQIGSINPLHDIYSSRWLKKPGNFFMQLRPPRCLTQSLRALFNGPNSLEFSDLQSDSSPPRSPSLFEAAVIFGCRSCPK